MKAEDSVPRFSDIGDIGDQNCLPGGGETETREHTILPMLPLLSGETKDATFELWKSRPSVQKERGGDIRLAIRRSLKRQASRPLMILGVGASLDDIPLKFLVSFWFEGDCLEHSEHILQPQAGPD